MSTAKHLTWGWLVALSAVVLGVPASALTITTPRQNETLYTSHIKITGKAASHALVRVVVQRKQQVLVITTWKTVLDGKFRATGSGRWSTTFSDALAEGDYRVNAQRLNYDPQADTEDTHTFRIRLGQSGESGEFEITAPRNGETVGVDRLTVCGGAPDSRRVRVRLTAPEGNASMSEIVRANDDGQWRLATRLPAPGRYRLEAELLGRKDSVTAHRFLNFIYRPGAGDGGGGAISITRPDDGATVVGNSVYVAGRTRAGADVHVRVVDAKDRAVHDEMTRADRKGDWQVRLYPSRDGEYRVVAELLDDHGRVADRAAIRFRADRR